MAWKEIPPAQGFHVGHANTVGELIALTDDPDSWRETESSRISNNSEPKHLPRCFSIEKVCDPDIPILGYCSHLGKE